MKLTLKRRYLGPEYTIGSLFVDDVYLCDTIEDTVRDYNKDGDLLDAGETKVWGKTAIPYGTYPVDLTISPKFKRVLPLVKNVRHFDGIRIHKGNTAGDSAGCILPGENKQKGKVLFSEKYEMAIIEKILIAIHNSEEITLHIE